MKTARLLILILLVVVPMLAQDQPSSEALAKGRNETDVRSSDAVRSRDDVRRSDKDNARREPSELATHNETSPAALSASFPDAPVPQTVRHPVIDKKFIAIMAALGGAETLRLTTHKLVLDHEFAAGAPWITSVPRNDHLVAKYAGIYAAEVLVAYELKKPHSWLPGDRIIRKLWWVYPSAMVPIHIKNGVRSARTQPPSCPPEECE